MKDRAWIQMQTLFEVYADVKILLFMDGGEEWGNIMSTAWHVNSKPHVKLYSDEALFRLVFKQFFLIDLVVVKFLFYVVCVGVLVLVQNSTLKSK